MCLMCSKVINDCCDDDCWDCNCCDCKDGERLECDKSESRNLPVTEDFIKHGSEDKDSQVSSLLQDVDRIVKVAEAIRRWVEKD